ncbi:alpha/beta hydrolase [Aquibacillus sediminis]|uniref:alpha/beta hydrolase n=1 Tax=Aquibacillus sediminis TaxID=2574734 RepID=UPI0011093208|nr:alpha/beta hydrolase [Aquibacillus sediminis]
MKKRLAWIVVIGLLVVLLGFVFAGNYFYNEGIKRGDRIELYSGDEAVEVFATEENQALIEQANQWYNEQSFERVERTTSDDLKLRADFLENEEDTGKVVILAHGYRGQKEDMREYVKFYYDQGFDVLLPDARGHGESDGDYIGYGWHDRKDYQDWIEMLVNQKDSEHIFLHGNSMGAALVLMASGEDLPLEVKGIIADSGYTTVHEELSHQLKHLYNLPPFPLLEVTSMITNIRAGYTFKEASAVEQVRNNTRPLFIIHGEEDELVPTDMAHELYEAAGGDKQLWIVPDAGHTKAYTVATQLFQHKLTAFIEEVLDTSNETN